MRYAFHEDGSLADTEIGTLVEQFPSAVKLAEVLRSFPLSLSFRNTGLDREIPFVPGILVGHFWRIEQTIYALCSSQHGVELLPHEYTLRLESGIGTPCFRHYVGAIRYLMYSAAKASAVSQGGLKHVTR
jgi:hypothetical protein